MSRSLFAKPLALLLMTVLLLTATGSKRIWAKNFDHLDWQYQKTFEEPTNDAYGNPAVSNANRKAAKRAREARDLAAAEKAKKDLIEQGRKEDAAAKQGRIGMFERALQRNADKAADPLQYYQDTRKTLRDKMDNAIQQGDVELMKLVLEALDGLKNAEHLHTHGRKPTLLDEFKDLFQSPAPPQPSQPVVQLQPVAPTTTRTFRPVPVKEWVRRQQETWVHIANDALGNNIPREDQIAEFTNIVLTNPGYYGHGVFIQPYPVRSLTSDDGGIMISDGDLNDTGKTNAVLKAGVAKFQQTQTRPYLVSAEAPSAAATVVHHGSAEVVAAEPVIHAAPSASVVTSYPRPVVQAESSVGVVTSRRPRRVVRTVARAATTVTVAPRRRIVEAPAVTVVRARPILRARPVVVRARPVLRARTVFGTRRAVRRSVRRGGLR